MKVSPPERRKCWKSFTGQSGILGERCSAREASASRELPFPSPTAGGQPGERRIPDALSADGDVSSTPGRLRSARLQRPRHPKCAQSHQRPLLVFGLGTHTEGGMIADEPLYQPERGTTEQPCR